MNAALVTAGAAWIYRQYASDPDLLRLEAEVKAAGQRLWGLPEAQRIPPSSLRSIARSNTASFFRDMLDRVIVAGGSPMSFAERELI